MLDYRKQSSLLMDTCGGLLQLCEQVSKGGAEPLASRQAIREL